MYKLFLDDVRDPYKVKWVDMPLGPFVIVRNYNEFANTIQEKGIPEFVAFDHDLTSEHYPVAEQNSTMIIPYDTYEEKTGYHAAKYLLDECVKRVVSFPKYIVHCMNTVGKQNIISLIESYKNHYTFLKGEE